MGEWEDHWALREVDLEIPEGATVGLIGPNGAGKSTALKLMARILAPDRGQVEIRGRACGLLELGAGFQLEYTGRENVYLNASLLGLSREDIRRKFDSIVAFSELEEHIDDPLRTYSSGMYMRLAFAIAIHVEPDVLLVDEILAVGDIHFQRKCLDYIAEFQKAGGTIVMVSHNLGQVQEICSDVAWIEDGKVQEYGAPTAVANAFIDHVRERDRRIREEERRRRPLESTAQPDVELGEVRLLDRLGEAAEVIEVGQQLTLEIPYRVFHRLPTPVFGAAIFRNDGVHLYGTNTAIDGVEIPPLTDDGVIRLEFPHLSLLPGTYRVSVGVFDSPEGGSPLDFHDKLYGFRVIGAQREEGLARIDHRWTLESAERPQPGRRSAG